MSEQLPYMPVFVHDVLASIADFDDAERGAYLSLVLGCWAEGGSLPADPRRLARRAGSDPARWEAIWSAIGRCFEVDADRIRHPMVTAEMARARDLQDARRRGAEATNARRGAQRNAQRTPSDPLGETPTARSAGRTTVGIPSPSPSPSPSAGPTPNQEDPPGESCAAEYVPPAGAPAGGAQPLITIFCRKHRQKYPDGGDYLVTGRDAAAVKALSKSGAITIETWEEMVDVYLHDRSPFHTSRRHPLEGLARNPNEFLGPKAAPESAKEAHNRLVVAAFLRRRPGKETAA